MKITIAATISTFTLIGFIWGAWTVFDERNAWSDELLQVSQAASRSMNAYRIDSSLEINQLKIEDSKVRIARLLNLQQARTLSSYEVTALQQEQKYLDLLMERQQELMTEQKAN